MMIPNPKDGLGGCRGGRGYGHKQPGKPIWNVMPNENMRTGTMTNTLDKITLVYLIINTEIKENRFQHDLKVGEIYGREHCGGVLL